MKYPYNPYEISNYDFYSLCVRVRLSVRKAMLVLWRVADRLSYTSVEYDSRLNLYRIENGTKYRVGSKR